MKISSLGESRALHIPTSALERRTLGILLISLPTAIVGAKFQQVYQEVENERKAAEAGRAVLMTRRVGGILWLSEKNVFSGCFFQKTSAGIFASYYIYVCNFL